MCVHPLHTALDVRCDSLRRAIEALSHRPLAVDALRCAVSQTRQLAVELAELAKALACHTDTNVDSSGLVDTRADAGSVDQTIHKIVEDLRTMSRHLISGSLLLELADDDLAHLRSSAGRCAESGRDAHRLPVGDDITAASASMSSMEYGRFKKLWRSSMMASHARMGSLIVADSAEIAGRYRGRVTALTHDRHAGEILTETKLLTPPLTAPTP
ncbi:hypothetical protein JOF56_009550 [Kibdelosporangium banguiense]|uniref:Uncharacterized protein n=1 Tax=Kibdelosporangium banguiense TaxID=1365924 RepID=A0ABS4TZ27_9PSEU|nr:hypothetical protein [Kibdelosporangium banguiense]MBP2329165.1 hypothetical protein [Kibdelosporangium banguiense]